MVVNISLRLALVLAVAVIAGGTGLPGSAHAQPASAVGQAQALVVQPIAVAEIADLDFGVVVNNVPGATGYATFSSSTMLAFDGGAHAGCTLATDCPVPHRAQFVVTGEKGRSYRVTTPASLTMTGLAIAAMPGAAVPPVVVDRLTVWVAGAAEARADGLLGADGRSAFEVGGRLSIPATATAARYRADIPVVVTYL